MEVFISNAPSNLNPQQLRKKLQPLLESRAITTFSCYKQLRKNWAKLTFIDSDVHKANEFLALHGQIAQNRFRPPYPLNFGEAGQPLNIKPSYHPPDEFLLRNMREEEARKLRPENRKKVERKRSKKSSFNIRSLHCGVLDYNMSEPQYISYFHDHRPGLIKFGKSALKVQLNSEPLEFFDNELIATYDMINQITISGGSLPSITLFLYNPPKIYRVAALDSSGYGGKLMRNRVHSLSTLHDGPVSTCIVYRLVLETSSDIRFLLALKSDGFHIPEPFLWTVPTIKPDVSYDKEHRDFMKTLEDEDSIFSWEVKFQLHALVSNGILRPNKVTWLSSYIEDLYRKIGSDRMVNLIRKLAKKCPWPAPDADPSFFSPHQLVAKLRHMESMSRLEETELYGIRRLQTNSVKIHKVTVTPASIYLEGPLYEGKNRVLRLYEDNIDSFLRINFTEEDGEPLQFDRLASLAFIFYDVFDGVLRYGINIGGRRFHFLGFSHSSLRAQSCWFMAPFLHDHGVVNRNRLISNLGDFSQMPSAAKCAARIGQAFSDTQTSIKIDRAVVSFNLPDVKKNGRVFSDGVGIISQSLLRTMWKDDRKSMKWKPTSYQIRYAGAKGMISLDSRLKGDALMLRPSMVKFRSEASNLEICGAAGAPLLTFLNRQLIKILEDLGVAEKSFLRLQKEEVDRLKVITKYTAYASSFLESTHVGIAARMPWLLLALERMGLDYLCDPFLRQVVQLTVIVRLRELKYKARIPLGNAVTMYGIMDETGFLKEGQIYCTLSDGNVLSGHVVVTRAPSVHPGDVQVAEAVEVPEDSSLRDLKNCVVFSQHGSRDLPSMLSGGDLDGDLYSVIFDEDLFPTHTVMAADYPKAPEVPLGRPVEVVDITTHFLKFMENDHLGRICNNHLALADQSPQGTKDLRCILLAEMASTAVDFSKTGEPVNISKMPKMSRVRADFMAPSPRVHVSKNIDIAGREVDDGPDDDDEDSSLTTPKYRYYESQKVLGKLYRQIDERAFFDEMESHMKTKSKKNAKTDILSEVFDYVLDQVGDLEWEHQIDAARDIKEMYEENLESLQYTYSFSPWSIRLTEVEVFIGNIVDRERGMTPKQRETSLGLREEFDVLVRYVVSRMLDSGENKDKNEDATEEKDNESLERTVACLSVAVDAARSRLAKGNRDQPAGDQDQDQDQGDLVSWGWIAAAVCLSEVEKWKRAAAREAGVGSAYDDADDLFSEDGWNGVTLGGGAKGWY
ncbi:MAG: hypothetical protein M1834_003103 [Cirrosporium novae-zelandiae]|nr:MAG: hypothetical protein M1834_003103 [Cirrosporium novae-zelandiae]